jgi:hypothetical protein
MSHNDTLSNNIIYYTPIICKKKPKYPEVQMNMNDEYIKELFENSITMTGYISSKINDDKIISDILLNLGIVKDYYVGIPASNGISKITVFFSEIYELKQKDSETKNINKDYDKKYEKEYVYDEDIIEDNEDINYEEYEDSNDEEYDKKYDNEFHYEDGYFWFDNGQHQVELYFY